MSWSRKFHFDLGIPKLKKDWKRLFSTDTLAADLLAGTTVACVAIPLSLAIAMASGVRPEIGLVTAVIGALVVAFFGGTPLAVSGPAAAMAVLIASVVETQGLGGLLVVTFGCGILQLLTGVFGLGRFIRYIPFPVIEGFTAGIGGIIIIGQLPKALGIPNAKSNEPLEVLRHIGEYFAHIQMGPALLALFTVAVIFLLPKVFRRAPAALVAVSAATLIALGLGLNVLAIGNIPNTLPFPKFPTFPENGFGPLFGAMISVYVLASLETLLSSSAIDKVLKGPRHNPDQELIGQGLGNMSVSLFGGIPITGVIARSMLNVQAGAKSRRAAIIQSIVLIAAIFYAAPYLSRIPVAVLAGVLLAVAMRMLNPKEFLSLWKNSRSDALVYAITFSAIIFSDLIAGVQVGIVAALIIAAVRLNQTRALVHVSSEDGPCQVSIDGPITFISSSKMELVRTELHQADLSRGVVFDLSGVSTMDSSGAGYLFELVQELRNSGVKITIQKQSAVCEKALGALDHSGTLLRSLSTPSDRELEPRNRLLYGIERFRRDTRPAYEKLLKQLATGQKPHTLFITCSDSRINPNLITSTDPGELFIVRNVGNVVPKFGMDELPAEGAAIEFAVGVLNVSEIVICGHSECGAIKELASGAIFRQDYAKQFPSVAKWLSDLRQFSGSLPHNLTANQISRHNILHQIKNLRTYPTINQKIIEKKLRIYAWYYDLETADIEEWSTETGEFSPIGQKIDTENFILPQVFAKNGALASEMFH